MPLKEESLYSYSDTEKFLLLYKDLEKLELDEPEKYEYLINHNKSFFDMARHLRNDLAHNIVGNQYPIIIHKDVYVTLKNLLKSVQVKAIDIAVQSKDIIYVYEEDTVLVAMKLLSKCNYSHLPLFRGKEVIGVVSETNIVDYLANHPDGYEEKIGNIKEAFDFSSVQDEFYTFVGKDTYLYQLNNYLETKADSKRKLGAIFITEHGRNDEPLLGMLRSWDILKRSR